MLWRTHHTKDSRESIFAWWFSNIDAKTKSPFRHAMCNKVIPPWRRGIIIISQEMWKSEFKMVCVDIVWQKFHMLDIFLAYYWIHRIRVSSPIQKDNGRLHITTRTTKMNRHMIILTHIDKIHSIKDYPQQMNFNLQASNTQSTIHY